MRDALALLVLCSGACSLTPYLAVWLMACGGVTVAPKILPPNVTQACERAIECSVFLAEQKPECVACLETVADEWNEQARKQYGDVKLNLSDVPCEYITAVAHQTRLSSCVVGRWYGP